MLLTAAASLFARFAQARKQPTCKTKGTNNSAFHVSLLKLLFLFPENLKRKTLKRCFFLHRRARSLIYEDYMRDRYTLFGLGWKEVELPPDGSSKFFRKLLWEAYPALKTTKSFIFCSRSLNSTKLEPCLEEYRPSMNSCHKYSFFFLLDVLFLMLSFS